MMGMPQVQPDMDDARTGLMTDPVVGKESSGETMTKEEVLEHMPAELVYGHSTYDVNQCTSAQMGGTHIGYSDSISCVITICTDFPLSEVLDTLIHEVFHVIFSGTGLWIGDVPPNEEQCVSALGTGVTELLIRNPQLRKFADIVASQCHV